MLVLTRRLNEEIVLSPGTPEEIVIKVVKLTSEKVRIGIEAGEHVQIYRRELADRIAHDETL